MKASLLALSSGAALALTSVAHAVDPVAAITVDIPFQKFVLTNGLTLIVHEDHKAPIVAVNLWYHVGSKNEKPGKTGFAHLFEHLMFTGSEHFQGSGDQRTFFEAMERIGATDLNGTTNPDRTDYFANVPTNALDILLWIESDRMGHLLGAIDQARLDTQRGVVQNEKRQYENEPYGLVWELILKGTAPAGHPYSWRTIGSMEDLNAASLEDVKNWFKTYYGAANVALIVAGDIQPEAVLKRVEHYFGGIPAGPPVARFNTWVPRVPGARRQTLADRVPQARLYKVWNIPPYGETATTQLHLLADVLASGKSSRLYKRLVYDDQIATAVAAYVWPLEISGLFAIEINARPGGDLAAIERALDEELARLLNTGPTAAELRRAQVQRLADFVRGTERIGGFGGKSDILALNQIYRGRPDFYQTILGDWRAVTAKDLRETGRAWLTDDVFILEVHPYPAYQTTENAVDRSGLPAAGPPPEIRFPAFRRAKLSNGLGVILAERHSIPIVNLRLQVDAGSAADQFGTPGTARLAMDMLDEGTTSRTALQISDELAALGATLQTGSDLDSSSVSLSALSATLDPALDIYADVILHPSFPPTEVGRLQKILIAGIQQEKSDPFTMALRVFPGILYGRQHAYGNPFTGSGTEESVAKLTRTDLQRFHDSWFKPDHATLIMVGDTTLDAILPKLEARFGRWKPGAIPVKNIGPVDRPSQSAVYLVDRPGSIQSFILAGQVAPPKADPDNIAIETMKNILGGTFTSRVNMNLREEKHWAYGAGVFLPDARGQRPLVGYAPVQADKTKDAMVELAKELNEIIGKRPIAETELKNAQQNQTLTLPGTWETDEAVVNSIADIVRFGLSDDHFTTYPGKVRALSVKDLANAAQKVVHADQWVWIVVGDRAAIEPAIRELGWGEPRYLDADGRTAP